jgi:hypothetical protein
VGLKQELVLLSDEVWRRTRERLEGLSDEEYLWEPVPGCWTIRPGADGTWTADWPLPRPSPEPFTTIAWRLWHLIDMYGENRAPRWLDLPPQGPPIGFDGLDREPPARAADAVALLERAHHEEPPPTHLVDQAAGYGRWDVVVGLVQRGAPLSTTGRTPLHMAAGAGELAVVQVLLDHGDDPTIKDPEFRATPAQWAELLRHDTVAALLRERGG